MSFSFITVWQGMLHRVGLLWAFLALPRRQPIAPPKRHSIPILIWEMVIDSVASDMSGRRRWESKVANSLQSCSLTCRAWTPRSRYHLFHFIAMRCSNEHVEKLSTLLIQHPALESRIKVLVVKPDDHSIRGASLEEIPPVPGLLSQVPELRISTCYVAVMNAAKVEQSLCQFTSITTLNFYAVVLPSCDVLRRIILSFNALRSLIMELPEWSLIRTGPPSPIDSTCNTQIRLRELQITGQSGWLRDDHSIVFFQWLAKSGIVDSLQQLRLKYLVMTATRSCEAVRTVAAAASNTLEKLYIAPGPDLEFTEFGDVISQCSKLRVLGIAISYHRPSFKHLVSFLDHSSMFCPTLDLLFTRHPGGLDPGTDDWKSFDDLLQTRLWASLKVLGISQMPVEPTDASGLRNNIPRTCKRRIVYCWRGSELGYTPL
ncbi:hypothetical protein PHLGIDRAFT_391459 [Phlebiopsis gigantea 11061_1 CR5-6]|uniref:F-box domain-containing protein n=1 Tax=Phlebiopsis gigantea (strain 11061_1 CR5-6) TaxID=745531 RepID=A0A0C3NS85_PHLG1|nr:hypothetical protein PHLGIDRAFT_391459 [Phlebiopsis gigantea 11061_1 CR5-6]